MQGKNVQTTSPPQKKFTAKTENFTIILSFGSGISNLAILSKITSFSLFQYSVKNVLKSSSLKPFLRKIKSLENGPKVDEFKAEYGAHLFWTDSDLSPSL